MDAVRNACDPEVIMRGPKGWPEPGPFFGQEAVMRAIEQLRDTFESDWHELNSDLRPRRRPSCRQHGLAWPRPRPRVEQESTPVFTVREGGRPHRVLLGSREALEAVGLSE